MLYSNLGVLTPYPCASGAQHDIFHVTSTSIENLKPVALKCTLSNVKSASDIVIDWICTLNQIPICLSDFRHWFTLNLNNHNYTRAFKLLAYLVNTKSV